jgi:hypothetical protein
MPMFRYQAFFRGIITMRRSYFAKSNGVYTYDGIQWKIIKTPQAALSLEIDRQCEKIFIGYRYGFELICKNENGTKDYHSISAGIEDVV